MKLGARPYDGNNDHPGFKDGPSRPKALTAAGLGGLIVDVVTGDDQPWWPLLSIMEAMDHEAGQLPLRRRKARRAELDRLREDWMFSRRQLGYALAAAIERRVAADDAITSGRRP